MDSRKLKPWTRERVLSVQQGLPAQYATIVDAGAGCGLRRGEIFGLAVDEVDFLAGVVHVVWQVKVVGSHLVFAPPKGRETAGRYLCQTWSRTRSPITSPGAHW